MFTWFTGDASWRCSSPWQPPGGFTTWTGTAAWARDQLVDQIDAHLDAVGLQLDTPIGTGAQGFRFNNVVHVMEAARGLLEEGVLPPRLFPFLDTAIISAHNGSFPNLATEAGRAYLYSHAQAYYKAANTALGPVYGAAGTARFKAGLPAVAFWHSQTMTGLDNAAVLDFKARFEADFGKRAAHRCQSFVLGLAQIIHADERNVVRHAQAGCFQSFPGAQRQPIVGAHQRRHAKLADAQSQIRRNILDSNNMLSGGDG